MRKRTTWELLTSWRLWVGAMLILFSFDGILHLLDVTLNVWVRHAVGITLASIWVFVFDNYMYPLEDDEEKDV